MKCQHCEKTATFHITELTSPDGPAIMHLCEEHAREFFNEEGSAHPATALNKMLSKQLKLEKISEELSTVDKKQCPMCGITFAEFRKGGRLGCPYDYLAFDEDLEPLLINIHGAIGHTGKCPRNQAGTPERQFRIKQLKDELKGAIDKEQYELAGKLRDRIVAIEQGEADLIDGDSEPPDDDAFQANPTEPPSH